MSSNNGSNRNTTILQRGLKRPNWICRGVKQRVMLVRDMSGSMHGAKQRDASAASSDLVSQLAEPVNKDGFEVAVVDFGDRARIVHKVTAATRLDGGVKPISIDGCTNITAGLKKAHRLLDGGEQGEGGQSAYLRPVILLFSDGGHNTGRGPKKIADAIKNVADLVTVAFGDDADEALLRELASSPQHFYRCSSGRQLRTFLAAVGRTMTATLAAGTNATQALTVVRH